MISKIKVIFLFALAFLSFRASLLSQSVYERPWQIKTNLTGFLSNALSFEAERSIGQQYALTFQAGANVNLLDLPAENRFEGYFFRLGAKRYLSPQTGKAYPTGFALRAELIYSHWRDWYTNLRGNFGNRWENSAGALLSASYGFPIGKRGILEPFLGIGYVPTWESFTVDNGEPPFGPVEYKGIKVQQEQRRFSYFSHFSVLGDLVISGGLSLGFTF